MTDCEKNKPETAPEAAPSAAPSEVSKTIEEPPADADPRYDMRVVGEPAFPLIVWNTPSQGNPGTLQEAIHKLQTAQGRIIQQQRHLSWLRAELTKQRGKASPEQGTAAAEAVKLEVVNTLREMLPQAKRAAKRGKPALLRLIMRTIRTKL